MNKIISIALTSLVLAGCGVAAATLNIGYQRTDNGFHLNLPGFDVIKSTK